MIQILKQNNHEAYIVGGAVRDMLLKKELNDVDLVTTATPLELMNLFEKTFRMNNNHQTVIVRLNSYHFEITTIRGASLAEDIERRDLTINSLAMDETGSIIDLVDGEKDLRNQLLRSFEPEKRMKEDPLRMLRVFRFVSELGYKVDDHLSSIITKYHPLLKDVAVERIVNEWIKLLKGQHKKKALQQLSHINMHMSLPLALTDKSLQQLSSLAPLTNYSNVICWTLYCLCSNFESELPLKRLALSNEQLRQIKTRLTYYQLRKTEQWTPLSLYQATISTAFDVEEIRTLLGYEAMCAGELQQMWDSLVIKEKSELAVSGRDLLDLTKSEPGPWMKQTLEWAEKAVVLGEYPNDMNALLNAIGRRLQR